MTFVMGAGVSVIQPALPALVSRWFPATAALATAVYANGLLIGEMLSAGLTIPLILPLVGGSWPNGASPSGRCRSRHRPSLIVGDAAGAVAAATRAAPAGGRTGATRGPGSSA